ncbi:RNA-binding protein 45-like [Anticarsia gemmatalis]|uniref:RNA-binding protein 45-like n=1 Tax=Anticarsia gemmatalis TaxID=129554 RepID=UPI003F76875A
MNSWSQGTRNDDRNDDKPPYSRIFVVCNKQLRVEDLRPAFESFGDIEDLHMPRVRSTGESKGIAYIKYSKTSSAALAIQEMHLKTIQNSSKPIRVMVAAQKNDSSNTNDEKYKRLFIKVHKEATEAEIKQHFSEFGYVDSVHLQRNKLTEECRGFAYVHYRSFLDAAKAYEGCDKKYKAIFATPKDELKRSRNSLENFVDSFHSSNSSIIKDNYSDHYSQTRDDTSKRDSISSLIRTRPQDYDTVSVTCSPQVPQKYIEKLFNLIPGMTQCKYTADTYNGYCKATVTYESEKSAAYAVERLNSYEFPSGEIISVKPDDNPISKAANNLTSMIVNSLKNSGDAGSPDLLQLADVIAQASTLLKAATSGREVKPETQQESFCSVSLPSPQPLASNNSRVAQRCFLVFKPHPPPISILKDVFCRFGDLIDVSTFPNKTFGFAKYASVKAAQDAIKTLHGATLYGTKMKVLEADEKPSKDDKMNVDDEHIVDHDIDRKRIKLHDGDNNMS